MKKIYIYIIIKFLIVAPVVNASNFPACIYANYGIGTDCCNSSSDIKSQCKKVSIHTTFFVPSKNIRTDFQQSLVKVLISQDILFTLHKNVSGINLYRFLTRLPNDTSHQSTIVLLIWLSILILSTIKLDCCNFGFAD